MALRLKSSIWRTWNKPSAHSLTGKAMTRTFAILLWGIALAALAGCSAPLPPKQTIQAFPDADPHVTIEPVACNVQIDQAQFALKERLKPQFGPARVSLRLYAIPADAGWGRITRHYQHQLTGNWTAEPGPEAQSAFQSITWRSDGWVPRYLSLALLAPRGCLGGLPYKLLFVAVPGPDFPWQE